MLKEAEIRTFIEGTTNYFETTAQQPATPASATPAGAPAPTTPDVRIVEVRRHFDRYRELVSQGKLSEAGRELEAIQALVAK